MPTRAFKIHANKSAAALIDLAPETLNNPDFIAYFSGTKPLPGGTSIATVYSGHQFGVWAGQLGDGRALLLGQIVNRRGEHWDIQLKGGGKTPYSRFGDGRAVMRSSIREYLCSEAMASLGIPTTRALCIIGTGETVYREHPEPGAIITRLAPSHIRFGHFEHFYYAGDDASVKVLADHVIDLFFPTLTTKKTKYIDWFSEIVQRTARTIAQWQSVGFQHGVMNTDNMSILGLTIDYGPFGFMEPYDPGWICNHSDQQGRYSFENQPRIGLWNLNALANALQPVIPWDESVEILKTFEPYFENEWTTFMTQKLGLEQADNALLTALLDLMHTQAVDYTLTFRKLSDSLTTPASWINLFPEPSPATQWLHMYHKQIMNNRDSFDTIRQRLDLVNPKYVLRNWVAETAIRAAEDHNDYSVIDKALSVLTSPFDAHPDMESWANQAPPHLKGLEVSCSS